jgi:hypothetical protein
MMDKLRDKYRKDIERQKTVKVTETGNIRITGSSEKLTGDDLKAWLDERVDVNDEDCEYQDNPF